MLNCCSANRSRKAPARQQACAGTDPSSIFDCAASDRRYRCSPPWSIPCQPQNLGVGEIRLDNIK